MIDELNAAPPDAGTVTPTDGTPAAVPDATSQGGAAPTTPDTLRGAIEAAYDAQVAKLPDALPPTPQGAAPQQPQAGTVPQPLQAPQHWPQEHQQFFAGLTDPNTQQWMLDRYGEFQQQVQPLHEHYQQTEQVLGELNQTWAPIAQAMNVAPAEALTIASRYLGWYLQDPKGFAEAFAKHAGLAAAGQPQQPAPSDGFQDPEVARLSQQIAEQRQLIEDNARQQQAWQSRLQQAAQAAQQQEQQRQDAARQQKAADTLNSFATEKFANGKPMRPHLSNPEVVKTMAALMRTYPDQYDLPKAYEVAIRTLPAAPPSPNAVARQAKLAAAGVQGGAVGRLDGIAEAPTLRDAVRLAYEAQENS